MARIIGETRKAKITSYTRKPILVRITSWIKMDGTNDEFLNTEGKRLACSGIRTIVKRRDDGKIALFRER